MLFTGASPTPTLPPGFTGDPNLVSPGVIGFIVIFLIAAATVLLAIDMTRRIRRVRYRDEAQQKIAAERETSESAGESAGGLTATSRIAVQWQRNASSVAVWKISWNPNLPGNGFGRLRP